MLSGGPPSKFGTLVVLGRMPSTASFSFCTSPLTGLLLSLLTGGGGRGGRLFLLSDFELRSMWNSPPEPSVFIVNDIGMPVVTGVVAEFADDDGDSDTAVIRKLQNYGVNNHLICDPNSYKRGPRKAKQKRLRP